MKPKTIERREFTVAAAMAAFSGVAITISGCGGSGGSAGPSGSQGPAGSRSAAISANHGHTGVITSGQLSAAGGITLDIRGTSTHPHTVAFSAAEVATIAAGQRVSKESSNDDSHTHTVTFN